MRGDTPNSISRAANIANAISPIAPYDHFALACPGFCPEISRTVAPQSSDSQFWTLNNFPATLPAKAADGTLRKEFGRSIDNNATHGSDAPETAAFELGYFFRGMELR